MYYPIFLALKGRRVLVVGGGPVAERKVDSLLKAGAKVIVVSPDATERLKNEAVEWRQRPFRESDLDGVILVISATNDPIVQRNVLDQAHARNLLVNTVDEPALCDFILPAIARRGDICAAVSTSGKSPALAAALRVKIEHFLTEDVERAAKILGAVREEVHQKIPSEEDRKRVFEKILESGLLDWIGQYDDSTAIARVREMIEASKPS